MIAASNHAPCRIYKMWDFVWSKMEEAPEPADSDLSLTAGFKRLRASKEGAPLHCALHQPAAQHRGAALLPCIGVLCGLTMQVHGSLAPGATADLQLPCLPPGSSSSQAAQAAHAPPQARWQQSPEC